ncbi:hypothetical protein JTB14_030996 [Gonioctena quinquepunctata]|nr:hypothetical protein JTB14_030996 [Gonioctena quinquepunctata]
MEEPALSKERKEPNKLGKHSKKTNNPRNKLDIPTTWYTQKEGKLVETNVGNLGRQIYPPEITHDKAAINVIKSSPPAKKPEQQDKETGEDRKPNLTTLPPSEGSRGTDIAQTAQNTREYPPPPPEVGDEVEKTTSEISSTLPRPDTENEVEEVEKESIPNVQAELSTASESWIDGVEAPIALKALKEASSAKEILYMKDRRPLVPSIAQNTPPKREDQDNSKSSQMAQIIATWILEIEMRLSTAPKKPTKTYRICPEIKMFPTLLRELEGEVTSKLQEKKNSGEWPEILDFVHTSRRTYANLEYINWVDPQYCATNSNPSSDAQDKNDGNLEVFHPSGIKLGDNVKISENTKIQDKNSILQF